MWKKSLSLEQSLKEIFFFQKLIKFSEVVGLNKIKTLKFINIKEGFEEMLKKSIIRWKNSYKKIF